MPRLKFPVQVILQGGPFDGKPFSITANMATLPTLPLVCQGPTYGGSLPPTIASALYRLEVYSFDPPKLVFVPGSQGVLSREAQGGWNSARMAVGDQVILHP